MAQLPPDGNILINLIGEEVVVLERYTEREFARFDPRDREAAGPIMKTLYEHPELTPEQRAFAMFWSGYFYAHLSLGAAG